jgi:hypothetical protein
MHEKSETIQNENGKWINVYGKGLPKEGQVLPILHPGFEKEEYDTEKEAVASAKQRSDLTPEGMFKDLDYEKEIQAFDDSGEAIPFSDDVIATIEEPESMEEPEGMLTSNAKKESTAKEDQIAKGYHQMPDGSKMKDSEMEEEVSTDVVKDLDEGRGLKGYKPPVDKMKEGWKQVEGSNAITVDTTHNHWKTREGYLEANSLYGKKPAWVKEPSLEYNPKTKKYDPIEKEEFVDLRPKKDLSAFA